MYKLPAVVESVLYMAGAEEYIPIFKKSQINISAFTMMTDEDLQIMGVKDEEVRKKILQNREIIPKRQRTDFTLDEYYVTNVIKDLNFHLRYIEALTIYALKSENVQHTENKLDRAATCLVHCVDALNKEMQGFDDIINPKPQKSHSMHWNKAAVILLASAVSAFYVIRKFLK